ncbi:hypothetical protein EDC01DRAFT_130672 [Geopyxis carbonaria]|nr:hypothetical protein EDC01DRAFT_130672 [Geopyxis carbonaria]
MNGSSSLSPESAAIPIPERSSSYPSPPRTNGDFFSDGGGGGGMHLGTSPTSNARMTTGKSGRVIEKLMAENDRLRRELKVETTAREEERKAKEALRQSRDSLQSTNDNLILQNNIDKGSLARKDRKIEELKGERDFEREQRTELEASLRIHQRQSDGQVQELKTTLSQESSERKRAVNEYDVLRTSFKRLDSGYRTHVEQLRGQLVALEQERKRDHNTLGRLEITIEQQRQELEKMRLAKNRITEKCEAVLDHAESEMRRIRYMHETSQQELTSKTEDANAVLGTLKHLIGVKQNLRDIDT